MSKILTVTRSEYLRAVGSKAFIIGIILMPVLFGGGLIMMAIAENATDTADRRFAVLDHTNRLYGTIEAAAARRNETGIFEADDADRQVEPRWIPDAYVRPDDGDRPALLALSERVESGELLGFLEVGADVFEVEGGDRELAWHTETPTYDDLSDWLERLINDEIRKDRFALAGVDPELVAALSQRQRVRTMGLTRVGEEGEIIKAEEEEELIAHVVVAGALVVLMFMLVMMSTPALMNNVLEEKMQRIAEVLISAVTPFELLLGKLFSAALVSYTLATLYVGAALLFLHNMDAFIPMDDPVLPALVEALGPGTLALFGLFMLLALIIYGAVFSALGAACSELQDAQNLMAPAMIVFMLPMFFLGPVIKSPDGTLATAISFFPPATPIVMFLRVSMPPGVDWWELALALVTTTVFTLLCVGAAAKIFRVGILAQGQTPSYRKLLSWVLSK